MSLTISQGITVIRDPEQFSSFTRQWDDLQRRIEGATFFQGSRFIGEWWRQFGAGRELRLVCVTGAAGFVGAAAMQRVEKRIAGRRVGVLQFLGMPDDILRPVLLVAPGDHETLRCLLEGFRQLRDEWEYLQLDELPERAWFLEELLRWLERTGCRSRLLRFHACPYLEKNGSWKDYLGGRSSRFPRRLRQAANKLGKAGAVRYVQMQHPGEAAGFVGRFFDVEARSWKTGSGAAVGRDPRYRALFERLVGYRDEQTQGHAIVLEVGDKDVAATIGISSHGTYYSLQIAHDREYDAYSPGNLLEAFEMEWFFDGSGCSRYEFFGGEVFSKRRWTGTAVATVRVVGYRPSLLLSAYMLLRFSLRPALKAARSRLRLRSAAIRPFQPD